MLADTQGYNPAALGMLWTFAGGGKLFLYQNTALILGYSFGFFTVKDLLKVGTVLTIVEGLLILVLVPLYWPQIGLSWRTTPPAPAKIVSYSSDIPEIWAPAWQHTAAPMQRPCTHTECIETRRSVDASVNP